MSFPNTIAGTEEESHNTYSTVKLAPANGNGQKMVTEDGRVFRFAENGAVALVVGKICQSEVPSANHLAEAIATLAAGVTSLTGVGATTGAAGVSDFIDGYIFSTTSTNLTNAMRIKDNTAIAAGSTGTVTLYNPTVAAFAAADTCSYVKNPWKDVIIHDSPQTALPVGAPANAVTASYYGWLQTQGVARILIDGTVVIGYDVRLSEDDDGAVAAQDYDEADDANLGTCGRAIEIGSDTNYGLVFLMLE
jgi:hypothetical protein